VDNLRVQEDQVEVFQLKIILVLTLLDQEIHLLLVPLKEILVELWQFFQVEDLLVVVEQQLQEQITQVVTMVHQVEQVQQLQFQQVQQLTLAEAGVVVGTELLQVQVELVVAEQVDDHQTELQEQLILAAVAEVQGQLML
jgi:hypothetical protein